MLGNKLSPKQVVVQSLLLNGMITGQPWYTNLLQSIANRPGRLSAKQEACLDKAIQKATGLAPTPTATANAGPPSIISPPPPAVPVVPNAAALYNLLRSALKHLKRPHIHVPMDLNKPIGLRSDLIKICYTPASGNWPETLRLISRVGGYSEYVGDLKVDGKLELRTWSWAFKAGRADAKIMQDTLTVLCQDPIGNTGKWGKMLSRCCYCNLPLSTPESLQVGYGDTCAKHYGLPWGKRAGTLTQAQILANAANFVPAP